MRNEVFSALKDVIKSRGLTYKDISKELGMSESGFKKLMSSKDCSVSKLDEVCDILNLSFADLVALFKEKEGEIKLNKKQEALFIKNPSYYHFFAELIAYDYKWEKVRTQHRISKAKCIHILTSLDKVSLIRLEPGNKVHKIYDGESLSISPRLGELVAWDIDEAFFHHARKEFKQKKREATGTRGRYYLKRESLLEMMKSMQELTHEFSKRSKREELLHGRENLKEVTMLSFIAQGFKITDHVKF